MKEPEKNLTDVSKNSQSPKSKRWLGIMIAIVVLAVIGSASSNQKADSENKTLQTQIAQYEDTIQTLQSDNAALQKSLDEANATLNETTAKLDAANTQLAEANTKLEKLSALENQQSQIDALNKQITELNEQISTKDDTISDLNTQLTSAQSTNATSNSSDTASNSSSTSKNSSPTVGYTVYITKTGDKYHTGSCSYLRKSKIAIDKNKAIAQGYTACSRCHP